MLTRCLVCVEKGIGSKSTDTKVSFYDILCLNRVFCEERVPSGVVRHIVLHSQVVDTMDCKGPIEGVMDRVVSGIGVLNSAYHVKVDLHMK